MFGRAGQSPVDLSVVGAERLAEVGKALRQAGSDGKGLRKELLSGIRKAAGGPMRKATRESWRANMPHRGGLNRRGLRMTVKTNTRNGDSLGVRLVTRSSEGYDMGSIDDGEVRHPVFGRWLPGVPPLRIAPGVITRPQEAAAPAVREQIVRAIADIARKVEGT